MAVDPRNFLVTASADTNFTCAQTTISDTDKARSFFGALGKIGDVNALNAIGGGKIGDGLRNLANISGAIRTGKGSLPTSIGSTIDAGANWVLDNTIPNVGAKAVELVKPFNPGVANQAVTQAKSIFNQVKQGKFKASQVPGYLQDFQNLERLARGIYTPKSGVQAREIACDYVQYAQALDYFPPKFEFMFALEFTPMPEYKEFFDKKTNGNWVVIPNLVKQFQRPSIEVDFDEVNMYNFKTRIQKKVNYKPIQLQFIDDAKNNAMNFMQAYINILSPLSNVRDLGWGNDGQDIGMNFEGINGEAQVSSSASLGPLLNKTILQQIKLLHIYDFGKRLSEYTFLLPRFTSIEFDEMNMQESKGNMISVSFVYDGIFMETDLAIDSARSEEVKAHTALNGMPIDPTQGTTSNTPSASNSNLSSNTKSAINATGILSAGGIIG